MLGYVAIGIPCGILCDSIGLNALQVFLLSALFYSGAGQFMIPNMYLAASPLASIIASVSLVNTRQMLYSASFAPECQGVSKRLAFLFAATVTDESYGVSTTKFAEGGWSVDRALMVNLFSQSSWALSNVAGVLVGGVIGIPLNIAAFAMTAIFVCLLVTQRMTSANIVAIVLAMAGVYLCKAVGLTGPAILVGALVGVAGAMAYASLRDRRIVAAAAALDAGAACARQAGDPDAGASGAGEGCGEHRAEEGRADGAEGALADSARPVHDARSAGGAGGARVCCGADGEVSAKGRGCSAAASGADADADGDADADRVPSAAVTDAEDGLGDGVVDPARADDEAVAEGVVAGSAWPAGDVEPAAGAHAMRGDRVASSTGPEDGGGR